MSTATLLRVPMHDFAPGIYRLTLTLSDEPMTKIASDTFQFDSAPFALNAPPSGGTCTVSPKSGDVTVTSFVLSTSGWVDDDLPLMHSFLWHSANSPQTPSRVNGFSLSKHFANMRFASPGVVTVVGEAKDALGSVLSTDIRITNSGLIY